MAKDEPAPQNCKNGCMNGYHQQKRAYHEPGQSSSQQDRRESSATKNQQYVSLTVRGDQLIFTRNWSFLMSVSCLLIGYARKANYAQIQGLLQSSLALLVFPPKGPYWDHSYFQRPA